LTYNIHGCVGADGSADPGRIGAIIAELAADVAALQEVDTVRGSRRHRDQAQTIAGMLGAHQVYYPVEQKGLRRFGLAVLSRFPIVDVDRQPLPNLFSLFNPRQRGALHARLETPAGRVHLVNTHLSLFKLERRLQLAALLAGGALADDPLVLCGDLNAGPLSTTYKKLSRRLTDVQTAATGGRAAATYHARSPVFRIDHIFVSSHLTVRSTEVRQTADTAAASDHLPLVADLELTMAREEA
jgi:endonuclease/exonuclease/phosphatase family metal-dependent hydrolase